jgi:hypothetical protein
VFSGIGGSLREEMGESCREGCLALYVPPLTDLCRFGMLWQKVRSMGHDLRDQLNQARFAASLLFRMKDNANSLFGEVMCTLRTLVPTGKHVTKNFNVAPNQVHASSSKITYHDLLEKVYSLMCRQCLGNLHWFQWARCGGVGG